MPPIEYATAAFRAPLQNVGLAHVHLAQRERARRVLNVAVAATGLLLTAPLMALIAAAIRLTSRGPVFFRQTRIGLDRRHGLGDSHRRVVNLGGRPFTMFKFRTMVAGPAPGRDEVWAVPDDPRVTPLGRVLRKYRFDELPQLVNVLKGDMNVVGPRPEQPTIFATLREQVPGYAVRQRVRPGITGWAQVNHHYDRSLEDVQRKVIYDLEYVGRQSVVEDLKIMVKTVPTMAFQRGAW
jgi:lipopolysaccharide/colanic/teichoic acid biosynthesis glycosyltransferase